MYTAKDPFSRKVILDKGDQAGIAAGQAVVDESGVIGQITRVHPAEYLESLLGNVPEHGIRHLDPDTAMSPGTMKAALRSAGAGVYATDLVMKGEIENAFCAVRPPGHHAERAKAMGFCFMNNVAIAARHALEAHGLERVAIVDFDVHHGNGTEDIFRDDPRVMMAGIFQHPFYPYADPGASHDNIIHIPLEAGTNGAQFREAIVAQLLPQLDAFAPELVMISAGFDALAEDPMAQLRLKDDDYVWITKELMAIAEKHCGKKVISVLEGGYNTDALGRAAFNHIRTLMDM